MNCKAAGLIRCFQCAQIVLPSVLIVKLYVAASKCYGCAFMIFVVDFVMYHFFKISSAGFQTDFTGIFFSCSQFSMGQHETVVSFVLSVASKEVCSNGAQKC